MQKIKNDTFDMTDSGLRWYRSLFWPVMLVFVVAFFVLASTAVITSEQANSVIRFAPILLIAAGIDLIVTRNSPIMGALLALITVVALIVIVGFGLGAGWGTPPELVTEEISLSNDGYTAYELKLDGGVSEIRVNSRDAGNEILVSGTINHYSELLIDTNTQDNVISYDIGVNSVWFLPNFFNNETLTTWDLQFSPELPLALNVDGGVGTIDLNLQGLNLTGLKVNVGVGNTTIWLPDAQSNYNVSIDGGVGQTILNLPANTAVRLEASNGVGSINVIGLELISTNNESFIGDEGVWESPDYSRSETQITIQYDGGVGELVVNEP